MVGSARCHIADCDRVAVTRGLCKRHYTRLLRHGDPTAGRTLCGSLLSFIEGVALHHTSDACLIWPFGTNSNGYGQLTIDGVHIPPHRFVCEKIHGEPPSADHHAAHLCGNGKLGCISPKHLAWKTPAENEADKLIHNTHVRGERHVLAKLSEEKVRAIWSLKNSQSPGRIAKAFGVSRANVRSIFAGKSWAWVDAPEKTMFTDLQAREQERFL